MTVVKSNKILQEIGQRNEISNTKKIYTYTFIYMKNLESSFQFELV